MQIYLAGKFEERKRIKELMEDCEKRGHKITVDWTRHNSTKSLTRYAAEDIWGVSQCDLFIGIFDKPYHYNGAIAEFGAALALWKDIWIIGHANDSNAFINYPGIQQFNTWEEAWENYESENR